MLQSLIDSYEELKKSVYIIDRGETADPIIIKFGDENFYHLVGLHKINLDMFFPPYMTSKDKRYKHMKKHVEKYERIITNQIKDKDTLLLRINTFPYILNLLKDNCTVLYNLKNIDYARTNSLYAGDYGLVNIFERIYCLLGLKLDDSKEEFLCAPQSWMADRRPSVLTLYTPANRIGGICLIPIINLNPRISIYDNYCQISGEK